MSKEIPQSIGILGEEASGLISFCNVATKDIERMLAEGPLETLPVDPGPQDPSFRQRTYKHATIPVEYFCLLKQTPFLGETPLTCVWDLQIPSVLQENQLQSTQQPQSPE